MNLRLQNESGIRIQVITAIMQYLVISCCCSSAVVSVANGLPRLLCLAYSNNVQSAFDHNERSTLHNIPNYCHKFFSCVWKYYQYKNIWEKMRSWVEGWTLLTTRECNFFPSHWSQDDHLKQYGYSASLCNANIKYYL